MKYLKNVGGNLFVPANNVSHGGSAEKVLLFDNVFLHLLAYRHILVE
jgi:hypothetical protein